MLSICIPIYAFDVRPFVQQLHEQAQHLSIPWELLLLDDASPAPWPATNQSLTQLSGVRYELLRDNIGRAAIRNELTRRARYDYLLFLDGDGLLESADFLAQYISHLQPKTVLCGGRTYAPNPPSITQLYLHWYYGSQREVRPASQRQTQPYLGFMTNNFVVPRRTMQQLPFDERINGYGHEDTAFGLSLQHARVNILHLDNPVRHIGLEAADIWLTKQEEAVRNLEQICAYYPELDTRLLRTLRGLQKWGINRPLLRTLLGPLSNSLRAHLLQSPRPKLRALDLLKLYWISK